MGVTGRKIRKAMPGIPQGGTVPAAPQPREGWLGSSHAVLILTVLVVLTLILMGGGCAQHPTPYQPRNEEGGFEESRLQEDMYRVSFKGNRATPESEVIDFLFLRCAEVTLSAGYTHFTVEKDFGRTQADLTAEPRTTVGLGFGASSGSSFWGLGFGAGPPPSYQARIRYHLAMFVIRLIRAEEGRKPPKEAYEASFLVRSLTPKAEESLEALEE